ncbi:MAG: RNA polymerase sigma factor [Cytophagaceae bacterium]|jgi:RNA polymerase sigma-70 factor (ECF subfamily)|nr:RNA polymerase sigma factor [Cytophagaceae bacterium]
MNDESSLLEGCKRNEQSAYEALFRRYAGKMLAVARRYSKTNFEAEDLVQESFIKIFQKIHMFENKGSFEGWIKRIVVNTALNHFDKTKKEHYHVDIQTSVDIPDTQLESIFERLSNEELLQILQELPEGYRMVFNLYVIEGYTHKEIGEMLDISEGTSKSQLFKAKAMLHKLFERYKVEALNG